MKLPTDALSPFHQRFSQPVHGSGRIGIIAAEQSRKRVLNVPWTGFHLTTVIVSIRIQLLQTLCEFVSRSRRIGSRASELDIPMCHGRVVAFWQILVEGEAV